MIFVVEGKHDYQKIKEVIPDANIIITNGSAVSEEILLQLELLAKKSEIVLILDPDFSGEKIRKKIVEHVPNANHIYLKKTESISKNKKKIGLEHVSKEYLLSVLNHIQKPVNQLNITCQDLVELGLIGKTDSAKIRERIGNALHIGYGNGKQFCVKLNMFNITLEEVKAYL